MFGLVAVLAQSDSGALLADSLQPVVGNFVSSVIVQTRRPYTVGDTVELDGCIGVVEDIDSRTTQIRALDGTHVRIPNANVVGATIVNLTREPVRRSHHRFPSDGCLERRAEARPALRGPGRGSVHVLSGSCRVARLPGSPSDLVAPARAPPFRNVSAVPIFLGCPQ